MPSSFPFLDFVMKFIYIFCHCQQNTFSKNIRCATTQISAKLHILFQFTKRSFCLDASIYSKKNSFVRKNPLQIFLPIFQKCFCYEKHFVSLFYWCFTVIPLDALFLVRTIFTFLTLLNVFFTDISGFRFRATEMCKGQLFPIFTNIRVTFFIILHIFYTADVVSIFSLF